MTDSGSEGKPAAATDATAVETANGAPAAGLGTSDAEWRTRLTPQQFAVLRQKGTERPFTGEYEHPVFEGTFRCAACGQSLFAAADQFDSGSGWPSFVRPIDPSAIVLETDHSMFMRRVEVTCSRCGGHLGHVFDDGPSPTGERWCINSVSLTLEPPAR